MKVLEVISNLYPVGGGETFAVNFSIYAHDKTILKTVILYKKHNPMFIERLKAKGVDFIFLDKKSRFDLKNAKEIAEIIKSFKPDVIHTENNALIPVYLALRHLKKKDRPLVFHTMHLAPEDECSNPIVKFLFKRILRKKKIVPVAITEILSKKSEKFYKIPFVPYVENGVDLSRIPLPSIDLTKRKYDVVVIGRFSYQKNHEFLVESFAEIKKRKNDFKAAFIGDGELFDDMKKLALAKGAGFIDFLGVMTNPGTILIDSKIIALGSRFEANPLSLLEGMAAGCIVVSSDVGGIKNIIKKNNGFLFELNDQKAFVGIVEKILEKPVNFIQMSKNNIEYSKQFSMENCVNNYLLLFNRYLSEK